ncbi:MAG: DUF4160 domain-containing protein [Acidobacteria bacterium]|nr:DUF4160 domain-containing protein [Acidobacteriota bacterium]
MSPTIFRWKGYRFYFFSREELRIHIHVRDANGQAKFWIEPEVVLEKNYGLKETSLAEIQSIIKQRKQEIVDAWHEHFSD